jgi:glyoxylase-like metal-dependent hydrolase (beta-lactamase superfamily II)
MEWYFILITVLAIIFIILLIFFWFLKSKFNLSPTGKISENIISIKNVIANLFIYSKGSDKLIIDAGFSAKILKKTLMKMDINPEDISNVFFSHSDPDHIGGLALFNRANKYFGEGTKIKNPDNYRFLKDKDIVMVGGIKVLTISSPGHRPGHACYLVDDEYLFTGDLLRLKVDEIKPFFKRISSDFEELLESIKKIAKLKNVKMMLTAHTGYTRKFNKLMEKWKT